MKDILSFITFINDLTDDVFDYCIDGVSAQYFFTHGGCYELASIIKHFIPSSVLMINKDLNHIAVLIDDNLYDSCGVITNSENFRIMDEMDFLYAQRDFYGKEFRFEGKSVHTALIDELTCVSGDYIEKLLDRINNNVTIPSNEQKLIKRINV